MKYLYKGMGMPGWGDVSGSVLLGWHEKVRLELVLYINFLTVIVADGSRWHWLYRTSDD